MEKRLILGLGLEICKMSLACVLVPESKDVQNKTTQTHSDRQIAKERDSQLKELSVAEAGRIGPKPKTLVLNYNPKHTVNIHDSTLI